MVTPFLRVLQSEAVNLQTVCATLTALDRLVHHRVFQHTHELHERQGMVHALVQTFAATWRTTLAIPTTSSTTTTASTPPTPTPTLLTTPIPTTTTASSTPLPSSSFQGPSSSSFLLYEPVFHRYVRLFMSLLHPQGPFSNAWTASDVLTLMHVAGDLVARKEGSDAFHRWIYTLFLDHLMPWTHHHRSSSERTRNSGVLWQWLLDVFLEAYDLGWRGGAGGTPSLRPVVGGLKEPTLVLACLVFHESLLHGPSSSSWTSVTQDPPLEGGPVPTPWVVPLVLACLQLLTPPGSSPTRPSFASSMAPHPSWTATAKGVPSISSFTSTPPPPPPPPPPPFPPLSSSTSSPPNEAHPQREGLGLEATVLYQRFQGVLTVPMKVHLWKGLHVLWTLYSKSLHAYYPVVFQVALQLSFQPWVSKNNHDDEMEKRKKKKNKASVESKASTSHLNAKTSNVKENVDKTKKMKKMKKRDPSFRFHHFGEEDPHFPSSSSPLLNPGSLSLKLEDDEDEDDEHEDDEEDDDDDDDDPRTSAGLKTTHPPLFPGSADEKEAWEVLEVRYPFVLTLLVTPGLLPYVYETMDVEPQHANWCQRFILLGLHWCQSRTWFSLGWYFLDDFFRTLLPTPSLSVSTAESAGALRSKKKFKQTLYHGLHLFQHHAKKGIDFFLRHGILKDTSPPSLAPFLFFTAHLDPHQVGHFISLPHHQDLLTHYMQHFEFQGLSLVTALRQLMMKFKLPGESQLIDRILDAFAHQFCHQNPTQPFISNADAALILSFSIIMLNTDQHHPQVKHRMTLDQFCKNLRGLNQGQDFDPSFLKSVYVEIQQHEIQWPSTPWLGEPQETLPKVSYWEQPPPWDPPLVLHDVLELIVVQLLRSPFSSTTKVLSYFHTLAQWDPPKLLSIFTRFYRLSPVPKKNHSAKKKPFSMPFPHLVFLMSLFHQVFFDLAAAGSTISSSSAPQVTQRLCPRPQVSVPCQRTLIDTLVSLFLYQCLPQPFTTYFNMVRQRTTPILLTHHPTAFSSTSNHASTKSFSSWSAPSSATLPPSHLSDVSSTTTTSAAAAAAAAAAQLQLQPPPPPPTPLRAGNSFFSFFSYLSTTFQSTEPTSVLNEEDQRHYQWVLTGCDIHHFFHENLIDLMPMLLDSIPRYPQATGFILHWCMTLMLHHPLSLSSSTSSSSLSMEEKKVSNPKTVPSFLLRFLDAWQHYLQLHSAHAVHLLLQLCPKYGSLVPSPYFQMMVPQHLPIDACVHLDTSMYECVIPYYSPDMYLGLLQKYPDEVHRWLLAYPTTMTQKHWKKWLLTINQVPLPSASKRGVHVLHGLVHHGQVFQQFHLLTLYLTVVARKVTEVGATALVYFEQAFLNVSVSKQVNKDEKRNKLNPRTSHPHSPNTSSSSSSSSSSSPSLSPSPSPRLVNPSSSSSSQKPMSPEPLHNETQLPLLPPLLPPPSTSKKEDPKEPDPLIEEDPWSLLQRVVIPLLRHYKWTQRHEELVRLIGVLCKWFLNVLDTFEPDVLVQVWDTLITEILEYVQQSEYLADTLINSLMNVILIMDHLGFFQDTLMLMDEPSNPTPQEDIHPSTFPTSVTTTSSTLKKRRKMNGMWTFTWSKITPVLPTLKTDMFPDCLEDEEEEEEEEEEDHHEQTTTSSSSIPPIEETELPHSTLDLNTPKNVSSLSKENQAPGSSQLHSPFISPELHQEATDPLQPLSTSSVLSI